jgi:transposase
MSQADRDRLVVLKKVKAKQITQREAAEELGLGVRQIKRLLKELKRKGDRAVIHGQRGRPSNNRIDEEIREKALKILQSDVYRGFGPTLASEYLATKHGITVSRETVRTWIRDSGLWRAQKQHVKEIHLYRPRRSRCGELVQWDTSEHDWLEGRGPVIYLISMIDDATSRLHARFVDHDSTEQNMRLLWSYLEQYGRPIAFYTDKATLFQNTPKVHRKQTELNRDDREPLPATQIGRALRELDVALIPAHSPQAKGRVERSFGTAQDRLVKGLRVAGARTLEQANRYLNNEYLPWWNKTLITGPASPDDAHRRLDDRHLLPAILSHVETRQVKNDYTVQFRSRRYQIHRQSVCTGLRGASIRVERRLDGNVAMRFGETYLKIAGIDGSTLAAPVAKAQRPGMASQSQIKSTWMKNFSVRRGPRMATAIDIANATS